MEPNDPDSNPTLSPDPTPLPDPSQPTFNQQPTSPPISAHPPLPPPVPPVSPPFVPSLGNDISAEPEMPNQVVSGGFEPAPANPPQPNLPPPLPPLGPSAAPAVAVFGGVDPSVTPVGAPAPPSKKLPLKPLLIALAAVLVVGVGSAAAYVGVIAPNEPANVLKASFINSLQQPQSSSNGTFSASGSGVAYKGTFSTAEDATAKAVDAQLNLTVSGVNFSAETRLVNQNVYIKLGDLSAIAGLANAYYPAAGSLVQSLSTDLSNKWIVIDSTLIDESASAKCALNSNWTLTSADINLLKSQYNKHPFATIQSTASATIGGEPAEKFVLNIDNSKLDAFGTGSLQNLSVVKALQKCPGATKSTTTPSSLPAGHGQTPLTVWVDKSNKRIVQVAASSDDKKSGVSGSTTITLHYGKVSIVAPSNPESAIQVLTDIENSAKANPALLNLFSGGAAATTTGGNTLVQ